MRSLVELEIDAPQEEVAALFADPRHSTSWMDDVERYEPVSGDAGEPGSTYRLIPRRGTMRFTATVLTKDLPTLLRLNLDASNCTVSVTATFSTLPGGRTRLVSEEVFDFKGLFNRAFALVARPAIRRAHRRHMEAFRRFAELELAR